MRAVITFIKDLFKIKTTWVLLAMSVFSISISLARVAITGRHNYLFMFWNLFLAFVPWFFAVLVYLRSLHHRIVLVLLSLMWLAFFPNAPYVLTDLMHLGVDTSAPRWFDLILLLSYGLTGMLYGFVSLYKIEKILRVRIPKLKVTVISIFMIYLSSFGIYLGRFLRWNTWDLVSNLDDVARDIYHRVSNPTDYPTAWVFTLLFGTLLNLLYFGFKAFSRSDIEIPRSHD